MGEKCFDFRFAHLFGMAFVVKEDVSFAPVEVLFFGAVGIVFKSNGIAHLLE